MAYNTTQNVSLSSAVQKTIFNAIEIVFAITTIIINIPLMLFIIFNKKLRSKKPNLIFLNIQFIHVTHSILFLPTRFNAGPYYHYIYSIVSQGLVLEFFLSMVLLILTLERLAAVKDPFTSYNITLKTVTLVVIFSWCIPIIFIIPCIHFKLNRHQYFILNTVLVFITGFGLSLANMKIYLIARQHNAFIKENAQHYRVKRVGNVLRASFVCFAVVMTFIVLWFPYFIHHVLLLSGIYKPLVDGWLFTKIALFIAHVNSFIDPIMFALISNATMREFKGLFLSRKQQSVVSNISSVCQNSKV